MKRFLLIFFSVSSLLSSCVHHQLPVEAFFEVDPFSPDSLRDIYPHEAYSFITPADTVAFASFLSSYPELLSYTYPVDSVGCAASTGKPLFAVFHDIRYQSYYFVDETTEQLYERVQACIPEGQARISRSDANGRNLLVEVAADRIPTTWYNYECDSDRITLIHAPSQTLLRHRLAPVRPITFPARDGVDVPAFLSLPVHADASEKPCLPAIIMPRPFGGENDRWEYNPAVQFFTNRGFVVLQVDCRGGKADGTLPDGEAREQAINDARDGAAWLISQGLAHYRHVSYYVRDDLPYSSADKMYRDPSIGMHIDERHRMAFFNDLVENASGRR